MRAARPAITSADTATSWARWINHALEVCWLLTVMLVPLAFLDRDSARSEAVIAYVEVPKVALLRIMAALMAILWLIKWGLQSGFPSNALSETAAGLLRPAAWPAALASTNLLRPKNWLVALVRWAHSKPTRWLLLGAWFYLAVTLLSTVLSGAFSVSLWGEIPGQDGYPAYTIFSYLVLFGVVATHLKTRAQLWRVLVAMALMGVLVATYSIFQHYGHDFLGLTESTGGGKGRTTAMMGNAIFAAAVMMMTIPVTLMLAAITPHQGPNPAGSSRKRPSMWFRPTLWLGLWGIALGIQILGLVFTFSRGPWLGTAVALTAFLIIAAPFAGRRLFVQTLLALVVAASFSLAFLQLMGSITLPGFGPWLGVVIAPAGYFVAAVVLAKWQSLAKPVLVAALAVAFAAAVGVGIFLLPSLSGDEDSEAGGSSADSPSAAGPAAEEVSERLSSISSQVLSGALGGRTQVWKGSWRLIRDRPWPEFDSLSLRWLRPLVGYGPDLFRYTYLLESRPPPGPLRGQPLLPEEPDHAHNFFIHQAVDQGFLGLLSSLGIFVAVFVVGGHQLLRRGRSDSVLHRLMLAGLVAIVAGRFLEMMVGVARVSDLTVLWVVFGLFAALPAVMRTETAEMDQASRPERNVPGSGAGGRRRSGAVPIVPAANGRWLWRLAVVALLVWLIVLLTWIKGVNYVRAANSVGDGIEHFNGGDFQSSLNALDRAIDLAPDVPTYYNYRANVYLAYQLDVDDNRVAPEQGCSRQQELPYPVCLSAKSLESNLEGAAQRPFYYRSSLALANSAFNLKLDQDAVRFYQRSLALVPNSWSIRNELSEAYIEAGQPEAALVLLQESLAITKDNEFSDRALTLQGLAYRDLGEMENAVASLQRGLELNPYSKLAPEAQSILAAAFAGLGNLEEAALAVFREAEAQRNLGRWTMAAQSLERSARLYTELGQPAPTPLSLFFPTDRIRPPESWPASARRLETIADGLARSGKVELAGEYLQVLDWGYRYLKQTEKAAKTFGNNAEFYLSQGFPEMAARYLVLQGTAHHRLEQGEGEDGEKAIEAFNHSAELYLSLDQPGSAAMSLFLIGESHWKLTEFVSAVQAFQRSLELSPTGDSATSVHESLERIYNVLSEPDPELVDEVFPDKGKVYQALFDLDKAARSAQLVNEAYFNGHRPDLTAKAFVLLGESYQDRGESENAFRAMQLALLMDPSVILASQAPGVLASAAQSLGRDAQVYLSEGYPEVAARYLFVQGSMYVRLEDGEKAAEPLARSTQLFNTLGRPDSAATTLLEEARAYWMVNDFVSTVQSLQRSLELNPTGPSAASTHDFLVEIYKGLGRPVLVSKVFPDTGRVYRALLDLDKSVRSTDFVVNVYSELHRPDVTAKALILMGEDYRDQGESEMSFRALQLGLQLDPSASLATRAHELLPAVAESFGNDAQVYLSEGYTKLAARHLFLEGSTYFKLQEADKAIESLTRSAEIFETLGLTSSTANSLLLKGETYFEAGELDAALLSLQESLDISKDNNTSARAMFLQGLAYRGLGEKEKALSSLVRSLELNPSGEFALETQSILEEVYAELGQLEAAANAVFRQAQAYLRMDRWVEAAQSLERSAELYARLGQAAPTPASLFYPNTRIRPRESWNVSAPLLVQIADGFARSGKLELAGEYLQLLHWGYRWSGQMEAGAQLFGTRAQVYSSEGYPEVAAQALFLQGTSYLRLEDRENAAESFARSAEIYRTLGRLDSAANSLLFEGTARWALNDFAGAIQLFQSSLELSPSGDSAASIYDFLGHIYPGLTHPGLVDEVFPDPSKVYRALLDLDKAIPSAKLSNEVYSTLFDPNLTAKALILQGEDFRDLGEWEYASRALEIALQLDLSSSLASRAHEALAEIYSKMGENRLAQEHQSFANR